MIAAILYVPIAGTEEFRKDYGGECQTHIRFNDRPTNIHDIGVTVSDILSGPSGSWWLVPGAGVE